MSQSLGPPPQISGIPIFYLEVLYKLPNTVTTESYKDGFKVLCQKLKYM